MSVLGPRGSYLEEQFFGHREEKLLDRLRAEHQDSIDREHLRREINIHDDTVIGKLIDLGVRAETIAALSLVPLIEVAWADRSIESKEAAAIARAAEEDGLCEAGFDLLQSWLTHRPGDELLEAWEQYVAALRDMLGGDQIAALKKEVMGHARSVAEAAGGLLGVGKISKGEQAMLARLDKAFG